MNITAETMRSLLIGCMAGMALLAAFYLRRREMSTGAYLMWGLLALLVPLLGPFLVILNQPGRLREAYRRGRVRHFKASSLVAATGRRLRSWMVRKRET